MRIEYRIWPKTKTPKREPLYLFNEIADMLNIDRNQLLSKITNAAKKGLPVPKAKLTHGSSHVNNAKRYYSKTEFIKFLKESE